MVAERPLNAVAGVTWKCSEEEQRSDDGNGYAAWKALRGYCEADGGVRVVTGKCRLDGDTDQLDIRVEPEGSNNEARDKFDGETYVSITIATVDGKQKTYLLTCTEDETTGIVVAQRETKRSTEDLERDLESTAKLVDCEMMVTVDTCDVDVGSDEVKQMAADLGAGGAAEALIEAAGFMSCAVEENAKFEADDDQVQDFGAEGNEELVQGHQECVHDLGNFRAETSDAGLLMENDGRMMYCVQSFSRTGDERTMQDRALEQVVVASFPRARDRGVVLSNADVSAIDPLNPGHELSKKLHDMGMYNEAEMFERGHGMESRWSVGVVMSVGREWMTGDDDERRRRAEEIKEFTSSKGRKSDGCRRKKLWNGW